MIRTLWAAAALLAIFAMHGLAAHASSHDPTPITAAGASAGAHAAMAVDDSTTPPHGRPGHEMAALGLCAVVLATSAVLLLVRLARPRAGLLAVLPRAVTMSSYPGGVRTDHAPPDLHALSILRC